MASVESHVFTEYVYAPDGTATTFDAWWTMDDVAGDLLSARWVNLTPVAWNILVQKGNNVNEFTVVAAGQTPPSGDLPSSGSANVPGKKYAFVQTPSVDGSLEWAPNFTYSVFRA